MLPRKSLGWYSWIRKGNIIGVPGFNEGLPHLPVIQIARQQEDELWILNEFSLYKTDLPSKLNILQLAPELFGQIYSCEYWVQRSSLVPVTESMLLNLKTEIKCNGTSCNLQNQSESAFHLITAAGILHLCSRIKAAGLHQRRASGGNLKRKLYRITGHLRGPGSCIRR